MNEKKNYPLLSRDGVSLLLPFIAITSCFALWGFANDITGPLVKAFSKIFRMSVTEGALVQVAFYLGYFCMAFPAALFIQRYSYKAGVILGLSLYAVGAFLFVPAQMTGLYYPFLLAYFVMTCGLSFLETSCNPYIYSMGPEQTATRRLNLAQAFNPLGALGGMYVAMQFVQARLHPLDTATRATLSPEEFEAIKNEDLLVLIQPYIYIGIVILVILLCVRFMKMPKVGDSRTEMTLSTALRKLVRAKNYREGVVAQFFYVGAQVMCWTFIIQYGTRVFMAEGLDERSAEILSQKFNIAAMVFFTVSRFICTWFLKYVSPSRLLTILGVLGTVLTAGAILLTGRGGVYCLVGVSACMSLMFPTIYGIALQGLESETVKFGSAGLIMAILGGSVFPPLQALVIDSGVSLGCLPATNLSFAIPLVCFLVITVYGFRSGRLILTSKK